MKFECKISENPVRSTTSTWYKDEKELEKGSLLRIASVKTSDKGRYRCVVKNDVGQHERTSTLTVGKYDLMPFTWLKNCVRCVVKFLHIV